MTVEARLSRPPKRTCACQGCPDCSPDGCRRGSTRRSAFTRCFFCDEAIDAAAKYTARASGGAASKRLPAVLPEAKDPRLTTEDLRVRYAEEIAGLTVRGQLDPGAAGIALAAVREARENHHGREGLAIMVRHPAGRTLTVIVLGADGQPLPPRPSMRAALLGLQDG